MKQNELTSFIFNATFTIILFSLFFWLGNGAKNYFSAKISQLNEFAKSDFANYKTITPEAEEIASKYQSTKNSSDDKIYDKNPKTNIKNISYGWQEEEINHTENEEFKKNPIIGGNYAQIGVFASREGAEEIVKILVLKNLMEKNFTSYVSSGEVKSKVFYVVEIGVFQTPDEATQFCDKLKKFQIGCTTE
jgi:hypothetical protein